MNVLNHYRMLLNDIRKGLSKVRRENKRFTFLTKYALLHGEIAGSSEA